MGVPHNKRRKRLLTTDVRKDIHVTCGCHGVEGRTGRQNSGDKVGWVPGILERVIYVFRNTGSKSVFGQGRRQASLEGSTDRRF